MSDLVQSKASVGTNGTLTLTARVYLNPVLAATFSAVNTGATVPTVTVGTGNAYVNIVVAVVPNSPVAQAAAELGKYHGGLTSELTAGTVK